MNRLYTIIFALLVPAFGVVSTASAQDGNGPTPPVTVPQQTDAQKSIGILLSVHHELPAKAQFESIEDHRAILARMATDRTSPREQKRALEALAYWPDAATLQVYTSVLNDPQTRVGTRHQTLLLVGDNYDDRALEVLERYLSADDVQLRLTAVDAIARTATEDGYDMLESHAQVETSKVVLERIESQGRQLR